MPGRHYLVAGSLEYLALWDLGYASDGDVSWQPVNIWGTAIKMVQDFLVHPTPNGMGICILTHLYVYNLVYDISYYLTLLRYNDTVCVFDILL